MSLSITVPEGYGYVVFVALGLIPILATVQGAAVTTLRKPSGVKYPNAYATDQQAKENQAAYKFNCAQRAHQNLLENMSQVLVGILVSGLMYPKASAIAGATWVLGRSLYAYGYITSAKPDGRGRNMGYIFHVGQLTILGLSIATAVKLL